MSDLLSKFDAMEFVIWTAVAGGLLIGLVSAVAAIVGAYWATVRHTQIAATLVQEMLDRNVPTDEIVNVLLAMGIEDEHDPRLALIHHRPEQPQPEPGLAS